MRCLALALLLGACSANEIAGTQVIFDPNARTPFGMPTPNDLQKNEQGGLSYAGYDNPKANSILDGLITAANDRSQATVLPVAYFHFSADVLAPEGVLNTGPVQLLDLSSRERLPVITEALVQDDYTPAHVLAVAPAPGIVLKPARTYAFIIERSLRDKSGALLGVPLIMRQLMAGQATADVQRVYDPLRKAFSGDVAAAAVFTTGDSVAELAQHAQQVSAHFQVHLEDMHLDSDDGDHPDFCEVLARVRFPQFQTGKPPFNTAGLISFDAEGTPIQTGVLDVPAVIAIPKKPMPDGGYPLLLFFHGSGGLTNEVIDRGRIEVKGQESAKGSGPALMLSPLGIAAAASALPVNPERLPGASDYEYLNLFNLPSFRDNFRQGVFEQTLFLDARSRTEIPPSVLGSCQGPSLPAGKTGFSFRHDVVAMGQSMGGMYANMLSAVEPRVGTVVATGAGGFWSFMILRTQIIAAPRAALALVLGTDAKLSHLHPALYLMQQAFEQADPIAFVPRISLRPLPGAPVRSVYEPVGFNDKYFAPELYDAMALAYGHQEAGEVVWPSMQESLALQQLDGPLPYPVQGNRLSENGDPYTGVVVQFSGDGLTDPHNVAYQLDGSKHQWRCFVADYFSGATPMVRAPLGLSDPCEGANQ